MPWDLKKKHLFFFLVAIQLLLKSQVDADLK